MMELRAKMRVKKKKMVVSDGFDDLDHNKELSDFNMELKDQNTKNSIMEPMG